MLAVFVDDEPGVLNGIERMLFAQRVPWDVFCIADPQEAIELIAREPVDVVVADLKMPGMDGPSLLNEVRRLRPDAVRLVLSAANEPDLLRRAFDVAHGFLAKPCPAQLLIDQVERGWRLREMLADESLRRLALDIGSLPAAPARYLELTRLLGDPSSTAQAVASVIGRDPGLAAKVLQLCNSAYFSGSRPIGDIQAAVVRLGFETVRQIVLLTEVYGTSSAPAADVAREQTLAALAAAMVPALGAESPLVEMGRTAALLAGVGRLLLRGPAAMRHAGRESELAAYLLALWNLPPPVIEAVALQAIPQQAGSRLGATGLCHIATALARGEGLDEAYVEQVDKLRDLPRWRAVMERLRERAG
jgi:HD-like signal output (HDOD) protein